MFNYRLFNSLLLLRAGFLLAIAGGSIAAQPESGVELAPPPLKILQRSQQEQLDRTKDVGSRTKLSLQFMEDSLAKAEVENARQNFDGMFRELGHFHALMDSSLEYLSRNNNGGGKFLDNFKRLEIGLRKFIPRFETIRRELPLRYEDYVRRLMVRIRDARSKATDPLFGETVIRPTKEP
jgi:hypothetical protein